MRTQVLLPFDRAEAISIPEAAARAGKCTRTIRNWCRDHDIGRRIGGRWAVSVVALDMLLAGDHESLQAYLAGDRTTDRVLSYFVARSIPLPFATASISGFSGFADANARDT